MGEKRPFGSRDWNNNGEYDFFDKVTDRYVYDKVTNYKPDPKPPKPKKVVSQPKQSESDDPFEEIKSILKFCVLVIVIGVILHCLGDLMFH